MLLLEILLPIYGVLLIALYIFGRKAMGKRHPAWLTLIHSLTLFFTFLLETIWFQAVRNKYKKVTPKVVKLLKQEDIKFHIVFGTLLFAYRNNNFADNDIDIAMYREDYTPKAQSSLKKLGFILKEEWYLDGALCEQTYINKEMKISMDIFHMSKGPEFAPTFDEKNSRYARRPETFKYSIKPMKVGSIEVDAPSDIEKYLDWNYGNWKKKDPNYHWLYGSSNKPSIIVENANIEYKKY